MPTRIIRFTARNTIPSIARYSAAVPVSCATPQTVVAAEYRAVGRNRSLRPEFAPQRKPDRYRGRHVGNCIQAQRMLPTWTEDRGKEAEAATRYLGKESLANMRITGIDPIVTIGRGRLIAADAPRGE